MEQEEVEGVRLRLRLHNVADGDVADGDGCYCDGTRGQGWCPSKLSRCSAGKRGGSLSDVQRATMVHQSIPTLTPLSGLGLGLLVGKGEKYKYLQHALSNCFSRKPLT